MDAPCWLTGSLHSSAFGRYTTTGSSAFDLFQANPDLFHVYHEGFKTQVELWPVNPVEYVLAVPWLPSVYAGPPFFIGSTMIDYIKRLPRKLVVADFGCGEAQIAASCVSLLRLLLEH